MSQYWLFKTEPSECSLDDLARQKSVRWDGIRNYSARNYLRDIVKVGDFVLIYHSSCAHIGIVGLAKVVTEAYVDPTQFDASSIYFDAKSHRENPRWVSVDIAFVARFPKLVSLPSLKQTPELQQMALINQPRLSVQPVTEFEFTVIERLAAV